MPAGQSSIPSYSHTPGYSYRGTTYEFIPFGVDVNWTGTTTLKFKVSYSGFLDSDEATITIVGSDTYTPPLGLKEPSFGITETSWMYDGELYDFGNRELEPYRKWNPSFGPFTHFVVFSNGDDTDNPFGTPDNPRKTIPTTELPAGSVVHLYGWRPPSSSPNYITIKAAGTAEKPVFIKGIATGAMAEMGCGVEVQGNYVIFENVSFYCNNPNGRYEWFRVVEGRIGNYPDFTWKGFHHVVIRHCKFMDFPAGETGVFTPIAMSFRTTSDKGWSPNTNKIRIADCVAYDNLVMRFGNWQATGTNVDYSACNFSANSDRNWCLDSVFHHIQSSGVALTRAGAMSNAAPSMNCRVGRNTMHHIGEFPVSIKLTENSIVSENKLYRVRPRSSAISGGVAVLNNDHTNDYPYSDNVWIIFNDIYDCSQGVEATQAIHCIATSQPSHEAGNSELFVVGNVFHHIEPFGGSSSIFGSAIRHNAQFQSRIVNNTIFKTLRGIEIFGPSDVCGLTPNPSKSTQNTSVTILGNLMLDIRDDGSYDKHVAWFHNYQLQTFDNCLHYGNVSFVCGYCGGSYTSLSSLQTRTPFGHNSQSADPYLANPSMLDFHTTGSSPHIGDGSLDTVYNSPSNPEDPGYQNRFPGYPSIKHDHDGRAYTGNTTIGAYK
jgi:hypothetical protein